MFWLLLVVSPLPDLRTCADRCAFANPHELKRKSCLYTEGSVSQRAMKHAFANFARAQTPCWLPKHRSHTREDLHSASLLPFFPFPFCMLPACMFLCAYQKSMRNDSPKSRHSVAQKLLQTPETTSASMCTTTRSDYLPGILPAVLVLRNT